MENQKIEGLLQTALMATPEELMDSSELKTGYYEDRFEIIVRFTGDFSEIQNALVEENPDAPNPDATELYGGYGILKLQRSQIDYLATLPQITYIEKPKRLFFSDYEGRLASCITSVQSLSPGEYSGRGVLVGIIDSGIDYTHPDFRNADGTTRILALWDQSVSPDAARGFFPPTGFSLGTLFSESMINQALNATDTISSPEEAASSAVLLADLRQRYCPSVDISGHGTHVAGIAAGNGAASGGVFRGVAYEASLCVVKLAPAASSDFPSTTQLMQAIEFCVRESLRRNMPLALNLSYGNTYGSHSGTSLIETYLDTISQIGRSCFVVGSGNEGADAGHIGGLFEQESTSVTQIDFAVADYTPSLSLQLWKNYSDRIRITLRGPSSLSEITLDSIPGIYRYTLSSSNLLIYYGEPSPYSIFQEIYIDILPATVFIDAGIWSITLEPLEITDGNWEMWMPAGAVRSQATRFLLPTPETTLTIPSTARRVITVGAYDSATKTLAPFSGRGYTWSTNQIKPDLVAPGVEITSCALDGGYTERTGTSMATPFVTGSAACLMQWGILLGNDSFLYGEKVKAYLHKGAVPLPAYKKIPNPETGWGALCLRNSLP